jgi:hypothetical protein
MSACSCQSNRVSVIRNPIRGLSSGSFERNDDFGRGTFQRTDDFGSWAGIFSGIGQVFKFALPIAAPLLGGLAQRAVFGNPSAAGQSAATGQTNPQSPFSAAAAEAEIAKIKADADAKLQQTYIIMGGLAVGGLVLYLITRRKR